MFRKGMWNSPSDQGAAADTAEGASAEEEAAEGEATGACTAAGIAVIADSGPAAGAAAVQAAGIHGTKEAAAGKEGNIPSIFFFY